MSKKEASPKTPGIPLDQWAVLVNLMTELRDEGAFHVFLSRNAGLRFIGPSELLATRFAKAWKAEEITAESLTQAVNELQLILTLCLRQRGTRSVADALANVPLAGYESYDGKASTGRAGVEQKVKVATEKLLTKSLQERAKRLSAAFGLAVEDVDVDLVTLRVDEIGNKKFTQPFLRVRVRYSDGTRINLPFFFDFMGGLGKADGFEIDCDESDIDLLVNRLLAAKRLLQNEMSTALKEEGSDDGRSTTSN